MDTVIFYSIVIILSFEFVLERLLGYLNTTKWSELLPDKVKDIYDADKYKKQQKYEKTNHRFGILTSTFSFLLIMLVLFMGGFSWLHHFTIQITTNPIVLALLYFGIIMFASDLLNTPFSLYDTFVIEEKFGFNKTTIKTYILDKIKGWGLSALLGGGILSLIIWFYLSTTNMFWLYA